jgi:hypothetical protein
VWLALETLSHRQQWVVTALQQLHIEVKQSGKLSNNQAAHYWNDLERLHGQVQQHKRSQEEWVAEALQ